MSETVVYVRASNAEVRRRLQNVPAAAKQSTTVLLNAGRAVLGRVQRAFLIKTRGGTDECGERWRPLSKFTITRRLRKRNRTREQDRPSSALSPQQREKWWGRYRAALARYHDKAIAARIAWAQSKRFGAVGHYDKYGSTAVGILLDTEALFRSLDGVSEHSVFRPGPGSIDVGTERPGAGAHHRGAKNLPQRRLWPEPRKWTSQWWQEVLRNARSGVVELIVEELK